LFITNNEHQEQNNSSERETKMERKSFYFVFAVVVVAAVVAAETSALMVERILRLNLLSLYFFHFFDKVSKFYQKLGRHLLNFSLSNFDMKKIKKSRRFDKLSNFLSSKINPTLCQIDGLPPLFPCKS